ncbi:ABC transporter ATP-binding protein [Heyndrickxia sp. NPDC080065]|uniref:ABC transporter ATP-binding protein n=1 Tax=Heyndrickxia sp. NPDC080065 TaxID=3390568 RepID=UPI003D05C660
MALIEVKNLTFQYPLQSQKALDDISLSIEEGEFVVFCGSSGCGKSTFLRQLKKELTPHGETSGDIYYKGALLEHLDSHRSASEIGFVMQNPENQIVTDKVWHELAFGLESLGFSTMEIRRRVAEMAHFFGIQEWFRKNTSELSGGQKQLLNLASIMAMQPSILLLDEPTSQLDPIAAKEFLETLKKLNRDLGMTILLVEHRLEEVFAVADRVVVMENGKIICNDSPQEVAQQLKQLNIKQIGLPTPIRVFHELHIEDKAPLTVKDGRIFLSKHFQHRAATLQLIGEATTQNRILLDIRDAWFRYEKELPDVLRGFSFQIREGEMVSIVGGNGTGKTTALNVMAGLLKPHRGKILLFGKKIDKYRNGDLYRNHLTVLPQNPQTLFVEKKVDMELQNMVKALDCSKVEADELIEEIIHSLKIEHLLSSHPYDLSGGEQQKVALAKVLLLNPKIILLDEPTKGIDAYSKQIFANILLDLKKKGVAIVMVTHDIEFSAQYSDRCAMFFDGSIVSEDETHKFYSGNSFYTTAAHRMSRHLFENAVTCEDVIKLCKRNQQINKQPILTKG